MTLKRGNRAHPTPNWVADPANWILYCNLTPNWEKPIRRYRKHEAFDRRRACHLITCVRCFGVHHQASVLLQMFSLCNACVVCERDSVVPPRHRENDEFRPSLSELQAAPESVDAPDDVNERRK